jgi:pilus assembly protein CpaB
MCAGIATYLTVTAVSRNTPNQGTAPAPTVRPLSPATGRDTRTIVVAAAPLRFGTALTPDVLAEVDWPASSVPAGAFTSREALLAPGGQRTVLASIAKNEPILAGKITGPGQRGTLAAVIEADMKAITIRVDDVLGVAGFVQPDDRVDVLLTRNERAASPTQISGAAFADLLLQNVRVLAIDQIADRSGQVKPAKAVTIEVTAEDAQKVALGASVGQLSLALRQAGSLYTTEPRRIGVEDLSKSPNEIETAKPAAVSSSSPTVTVTRGARERILYEFTPTGRRELQGRDQVRSATEREQSMVATEGGVSQIVAKPQ